MGRALDELVLAPSCVAARSEQASPPHPPATSTCPVGSSVAVCWYVPTFRLPVAVHVPVLASYRSALARALLAWVQSEPVPRCIEVVNPQSSQM